MRKSFVVLAFVSLMTLSAAAQAQRLTGTYVFGDSTVDGGWWQGAFNGQCDGAPTPCTPAQTNTQKNQRIQSAIIAGHNGAPVGSSNLMGSQILAGFFGLNAIPSNQPGGTNYAIAGATDSNATGGQGNLNANPLLPSTSQQITNYLSASGGVANRNGLFVISSGGNDNSYAQDNLANNTQRRAFMIGQANTLAQSIAGLSSAGARFIVVESIHGTGGAGTIIESYAQQLWGQLSAAGVNFVPADISAVVRAVRADPTRFGFTAATVLPGVVSGGTSTGSACVIHSGAAGPQTGWGQWCVNTTTPSSQYAYLASADAQQRFFYSDDQHFSAAGQKIEADYIYSLLAAPSQVSMLAENAIKTRTALVGTIQRQMDATEANKGGGALTAWVTGDVSSLKIDNYPGFPHDPSTPLSLTGGMSYRVMPGVFVGGAVSIGQNTPKWGGSRGEFKQDEISGSVYAAALGSPLWATAVGTYGTLNYDVTRVVPIGIASYTNLGDTSGKNWSVGGQAGYDFRVGQFKTGPVAGLLWQRATIDGFTEGGGDFTSLGFSNQARNSLVSTLGWRAKVELGAWQPFAQVVWNHELASTDRDVTAFLVSTSYAPSYHMPAVVVGKDWGTASVGTTLNLGSGMLALGSVQTEFGDHGVRTYGGQIGLNVRF